MTPRFPTSARFRRHQRSMPLLPILGAALLTGGGLFFLLKSPDPSETVNKQPQAPLNGAEQGLRSPLPAPKAAAVARASSHAQAESRLVIKTDNRWVSVKEGTPLSQPNNKAIPSTDRRQINTAMGGQSKLKPASDSRYEHMLEIRAEKKLETAANKRVSRGDGGNAMAGAKAQMRPLSQPDRAQKAAFTSHPLPRTLPPKLREQEMDLTFYKGLANKKIILPEEPTEKQGRPRIWAGLSPRTTDAGRAYGPRDFAKATIKLTRQKLAQSSEATADAHKPSASTKKMSQNTKKRSTTAADQKNYQVQIAILSNKKNANTLANNLRNQGAANPRISTLKYRSGRSVFRVRLGPFATQREAAKAGQRWQAAGQPVLITSIE